MRASSVTAVASILVVLLAFLPMDLLGQSPRGATVVVTKLDGARIAGELIAVKPGGLLLVDGRGLDVSVTLADIQAVRVVKKSRGLSYLLIGAAAGAVGGFLALYKATEGEYGEHDGLGPATLCIAGAAGLVGLGIGALAGKDATFTVAARSKEEVDRFWERLRTSSREGRSGARTAPRRRPRVGLSMGLAFAAAITSTSQVREGMFRFPDEPSPETGPYPSSLYARSPGWGDEPWEVGRAGPLCLTYEWKKNWLLELDLFPHDGGFSSLNGQLRFTSSEDGLAYFGNYYAEYRARFFDLLAGLAFRSAIPGTAERQSFEIGVAAGPALVSLDKRLVADVENLSRLHRTAFSARARAAWDYHFLPEFSLGIFAECRFVRTTVPPAADLVETTFFQEGDSVELVRLTEVDAPSFTLQGSRLFCGIRTGFRF